MTAYRQNKAGFFTQQQKRNHRFNNNIIAPLKNTFSRENTKNAASWLANEGYNALKYVVTGGLKVVGYSAATVIGIALASGAYDVHQQPDVEGETTAEKFVRYTQQNVETGAEAIIRVVNPSPQTEVCDTPTPQ